MSKSENPKEKNVQKGQGFAPAMAKTGKVIGTVWEWIFKLRKLILAVPVIVATIILAVRNMKNLPEEVGLILLTDGIAEQMIPRDIAVYAPVAVTSLCLLLMMCSRRTLYPWLISIFSLILPIMVMICAYFPL